MSEVYTVGRVTYQTKSTLLKDIRKILYSYTPGREIKGSDFQFLMDLFSSHLDWEKKKGPGVAYITVEFNTLYPGNKGFWVTRIDGTRTDISFVKCMAKPTHASHVYGALRAAIADQVIEFKTKYLHYGSKCAICGDLLDHLDHSSVHVDHEIPFIDLVDEFLHLEQLHISEVEVFDQEDGSIGRRLVDRDLLRRWIEYHREHALLRLTTKWANMSRSRRRKRQGASSRSKKAADRRK